jgi:hypothetical protein
MVPSNLSPTEAHPSALFRYNNHAFYEDKMVKRDGSWRFVRRNYRYVWLDLKSTIGGDVLKLERRLSQSQGAATAISSTLEGKQK